MYLHVCEICIYMPVWLYMICMLSWANGCRFSWYILPVNSVLSLYPEPKPVRFCGRKIEANPCFTLFLTTATPLTSFPPTLTSIVCALDFSLSQPWVQEVLFQTACGVTDSPQHFAKVCACILTNGYIAGGILYGQPLAGYNINICIVSLQILSDVVRSDQEVKKAERNLLSLLYNSRQDDYWRLSQKVSGTVAAKKKVRAGKEDRDACIV